MKLAEALKERADLNRKIESLRHRLENNCIVQEGEEPPENIEELITSLNESIERLEKLMASINLTNSKTVVDGSSLTELIAKKDSLLVKASIYRSLINEASSVSMRVRGTEIKIVPTVSVRDLQKEADLMSKEIRELDNKLQLSNWQIDLIESV